MPPPHAATFFIKKQFVVAVKLSAHLTDNPSLWRTRRQVYSGQALTLMQLFWPQHMPIVLRECFGVYLRSERGSLVSEALQLVLGSSISGSPLYVLDLSLTSQEKIPEMDSGRPDSRPRKRTRKCGGCRERTGERDVR
ncbi:hypothetical protein SCP_0509300 [Sparassis crispa]|uniref:Uncharacterized protein n=1 Tax=Sparassis crispa TaxID=139825 RepID=A0A401GNS7_9APHY|nr:hypothetical protein SCP_0509300 [Sparassis crispa]GBE83873.1 hypothetical protein SCP_0509300 [Sparassis crispa]